MSIPTKDFFDLTNFEHRDLFSKDPVFSALVNLPSYFKTLPLGQILSPVPNGSFLVSEETIYIGKNVKIDPGVMIAGPCYIGSGSEIRHGAFLRGGVFLAENSIVGHATEVKNSIFLEGAAAPHFAYVGDSILGRKVNLGAGVKCANLKLDRSEIVLSVFDQKVKTGLTKLGAIIGDFAQIGCNAVLNPGTLIFKKAVVYASLNVSGVIFESAVVKPACFPKILKRKERR